MHGTHRTTQCMPCGLIASHDPNLRRLIAELFRFDGYPTQIAADGEEGLELLHQARESCIVVLNLDLYPDMWALMNMLHENRFLRAHHRLIQMDTYCQVETARSLEPDDVLVMPFTATHAFDVVERNAALLKRRKARRPLT